MIWVGSPLYVKPAEVISNFFIAEWFLHLVACGC
jgi:hypothetical protein